MEVMSDTARKELHALVDGLPDEAVNEARERLVEITNAGDPFADMDPEERERLHAVLAQSRAEHEAGLGIPAEEALARLRSR